MRIVKQTNSRGEAFVEYNKKTKSLRLIDINKETIIQETSDDITVETNNNHDTQVINTRSVQAKQDTFMNFEYTKYRGGNWQLRRPNNGMLSTYYFNINETTSNRSALNRYQTLVEDLNTLEWKYLGSSVLAGAGTVVAIGEVIGSAGALTPKAILTAAGATGPMLNYGLEMSRKGRECYDQYFTVHDRFY